MTDYLSLRISCFIKIIQFGINRKIVVIVIQNYGKVCFFASMNEHNNVIQIGVYIKLV